jgi:hypothetical protein
VDLPQRLYILARVPSGGPREDQMALYSVPGPDGRPITPAFSRITKVAEFLQGAQDLGRSVPLDYVFPADGPGFQAEFPGYTIVVDPAAAEFFGGGAPGSPAQA